MNTSFFSRMKTAQKSCLIIAAYLLILFSHIAFSQDLKALEKYEIKKTENLSLIIKANQQQTKVIILYVSSSFCRHCKKLEKEILLPMLKSGDYNNTALLRKFVLDSKKPVINFNNQLQSPKSIMRQYKVKITPTLLFLDKNGKQLSDAIVGYSNDEFFWYYLDMAIEKSNQQLNKLAVGSLSVDGF